MQTENRSVGGGITFLGLLQVALIVLKLCNVIDWTWALVLAPLWIELGIVAIFILISVIVIICIHCGRKL